MAATRIYGLEQAVTGEVASERGNFVDSDGVPLVRLPWRVDERLIPCAPAPRLGQHIREVSREIGYTDERIKALAARGLVKEVDGPPR